MLAALCRCNLSTSITVSGTGAGSAGFLTSSGFKSITRRRGSLSNTLAITATQQQSKSAVALAANSSSRRARNSAGATLFALRPFLLPPPHQYFKNPAIVRPAPPAAPVPIPIFFFCYVLLPPEAVVVEFVGAAVVEFPASRRLSNLTP